MKTLEPTSPSRCAPAALGSTDWQARARSYRRLQWTRGSAVLEALVRLCGPLAAGHRHLDLGTGTGRVLQALARAWPEASYHGLDACAAMLAQLDPRWGFDLVHGAVEQMAALYPPDSFDSMSASMVLHHIDEPARALGLALRHLRPGGRLVVCEGVPPAAEALDFYTEVFRLKEKRHVFLPGDLVGLLREAGFRDVRCETVVLRGMSLENWLRHGGVPAANVARIRSLHWHCPRPVWKLYRMEPEGDDLRMDWSFALVSGRRA